VEASVMVPLAASASPEAASLRVGEVAKRSGLSVKTIRALRTMDVSIAEVARILEVCSTGVCPCSTLKQSITTKMDSIDARIDQLDAMRDQLKRLLSSWQDCGGVKSEAIG
jgi:hypothetical protein